MSHFIASNESQTQHIWILFVNSIIRFGSSGGGTQGLSVASDSVLALLCFVSFGGKVFVGYVQESLQALQQKELSVSAESSVFLSTPWWLPDVFKAAALFLSFPSPASVFFPIILPPTSALPLHVFPLFKITPSSKALTSPIRLYTPLHTCSLISLLFCFSQPLPLCLFVSPSSSIAHHSSGLMEGKRHSVSPKIYPAM